MSKIERIIKRDGSTESFELEKVINAITKAWIEVGEKYDGRTIKAIASDVQTLIASINGNPTVEEVQDAVELKLADKYPKVAIAYAKYRTRQEIKRKAGWELSDLGKRIYEGKYRNGNESFEDFLDRTSNGNRQIRKRILNKEFLFGGRILANRGLQHEGRKVTFSNCYVLPSPEDNIESIYDTAKYEARTFSYGGGAGLTLNKLRPKGMSVNNSAKTTTGAVSFAGTYSDVAKRIGQNGRRGALMLAMSVKHPEIFDFVKLKTNLTETTHANLSIQILDAYMECVKEDDMWTLEFDCADTGDRLEKEIHAKGLFNLIAKTNWDYAEPGMLFWDRVNGWHLMSAVPGYEFTCTNPCGELPLMDWGACLLGSVNLSKFVKKPFTPEAEFDIEGFANCVREAIIALDEVVDENIPLHPIQEQRDYATNYRPIGLGIMGLADMLLMMDIQYGCNKAVDLSKTLAFTMINEAVFQSVMLAKEKGAFPKCNSAEILQSEFVKSNIAPDLQLAIEKYGLRNAQLLSIAPTGSLSSMLGVSGGIEPIFMSSYTRKVESIGTEDEYYKVVTPVIAQYLEVHTDKTEEDVRVAINLPYEERIHMQSAWQQFVDNAISSTINLPNQATVEDVKNIYMLAWEWGLKGVTVYRDGCKRSGILSNHAEKEESTKGFKCPECQGELIKSNGCATCIDCGYSPCSL